VAWKCHFSTQKSNVILSTYKELLCKYDLVFVFQLVNFFVPPHLPLLCIVDRTVTAATPFAVSCFQEFVNFIDGEGIDSVEYSQSCKGKNTVILGFVWTHNNEIVFVTDHGVELFQV